MFSSTLASLFFLMFLEMCHRTPLYIFNHNCFYFFFLFLKINRLLGRLKGSNMIFDLWCVK